jgi:hypothetical protein
MIELWPIALTAGVGLVAWGELRQKVQRLRDDVDKKVDNATFQQVDTRMERIERQVDRLVDTLVERN